MYSPTQLRKMIFFDLETASGMADLATLEAADPALAKLWTKRAEYLRSNFAENAEKSDAELYVEKAALTPEFSRIVCASFGRLEFKEDEAVPRIKIKSEKDMNELHILKSISIIFEKFHDWKFVGHNIKRFDIPMICKRMSIHGIPLPTSLRIGDLKPWELPYIDTSDIWSFGAWQEKFSSLELITTVLGIPSPKEDMHGSDVGKVFWEDGDISRIAEYCENDVRAVTNIVLKLSQQPLVEELESA